MRRTRINTNFGNGFTIDPEVALRAAKAVALSVTERDDAIMMLDMVGLILPQPGNEPVKRSRAPKEKDESKDRLPKPSDRLAKISITPEEIGEEY